MELSRKGLVVLSLVGITAAVGAVSLISSTPIAAAPSGVDLASVLTSRSPGARAGGALPNKFVPPRIVRYVPAPAPDPRTVAAERPAVLPVPVAIAATGVPGGGPGGFVPAGGPAPVPAAIAGPPLAPVAAAPVGGGLPLAGVAGLGALALVPLIFGGGGDGDASTAPDSAPAVPEPDTWLMMMVGFGVLGLALRRQRAAARISSEGAARMSAPQMS